jgi:hypothetical protein
MRYAEAELTSWLANERMARERNELEMARLVREGSETPTLRQRAGQAVISLGERLVGDAHRAGEGRRLAARPS